MSKTKILAESGTSQWKDTKVSGGSRNELSRTVAQIRSQVKDERRIFSTALSLGIRNKTPK